MLVSARMFAWEEREEEQEVFFVSTCTSTGTSLLVSRLRPAEHYMRLSTESMVKTHKCRWIHSGVWCVGDFLRRLY